MRELNAIEESTMPRARQQRCGLLVGQIVPFVAFYQFAAKPAYPGQFWFGAIRGLHSSVGDHCSR